MAGGEPDGLVLRGVIQKALISLCPLYGIRGEGAIVTPMTRATMAFVTMSIVVNLTSVLCMLSFPHSYATQV